MGRLMQRDISDTLEKYIAKYMDDPDYNSYVLGAGVSLLGVQVASKALDVSSLSAAESLDDFCIAVSLAKFPPRDLILPGTFEGVRVFYLIGGEIAVLPG